jgi:UDP-N-acetyl-2-amino-2-deoxyglucuronate dehydrogenase
MKSMSVREHGFAVIGCGVISDTHIQAIKKLANARLVGVCDVREDVARSKATEAGCEYFTDIAQVLRRDDVDIVDIVVPSGLHARLGVQAARAGKHVIVTKPIDITLENIDALIGACQGNGVKLAATHQLRSFPVFKRMNAAMQDGRLGRPLYGSAFIPWFRNKEYYAPGRWQGTRAMDGGGALMNQSIHYIDLLVWMMGPVKSVCGFADHLYHDIEVEDCGTAALKFASGAQGIIQGTTCTYRGMPARLELHGTQGNVISLGDETIQLWQVEGEEEEVAPAVSSKGGASRPEDGMLGRAVDAHVEQMADLLDAIDNGREPELNGPEARRAVEVILAIYRSSETGQEVQLA